MRKMLWVVVLGGLTLLGSSAVAQEDVASPEFGSVSLSGAAGEVA